MSKISESPVSIQLAIRHSARSLKFPDQEWLESVGFEIKPYKFGFRAAIVVDSADGSKLFSKIELEFVRTPQFYKELYCVLVLYKQDLEHAAIPLLASFPKTRADVVRLCRALNVEKWRSSANG